MSSSPTKTAGGAKATRPQPQKRPAQPRPESPPRPEPTRRLQVAICGCGYWGPNLIRNFSSAPTTEVAAICDRDPQRLQRVAGLCPQAERVEDFREALADPNIDAVAIATPVGTHSMLATAALEAGKHVLVEKPLAASTREAEHLVALADKLGLTLMVDHTFVYSPAIRKIKELVQSGELGEIYYVDSVRINLGLFQEDVNVIWDLAPHDLSIVDYILERRPRSLTAMGTCHAGRDIEDVAYLNLDFGDNLIASFHVNWLSPVKLRHMIVAGSKKSLVYNDLNFAEPIKVYDRGISLAETAEARHGVLISYRTGDIWSPHLEQQEPLQNVVRHFADCIANKSTPLTDGEAGLRVVRILEAAQRSIKAQGGRLIL
jgi:predicted dehydrogenase